MGKMQGRIDYNLLLLTQLLVLPLALAAPLTIVNDDIFSPSVFNAAFYSSTQPDIDHSSALDAQNHWQNFGLAEGRQAHGCFHTLQYMARYPDVRAACNNSPACALAHYLEHGILEGRLGFVEDGVQFGRSTIVDAELGICASAGMRTAGAVDSIVFQNNEMINTHDHGRQLQVAVTLCSSSTPESCRGECYNPTEAGASSDGRWFSTSVLLKVSTPSNARLSTSVLPAFWLHPGEQEPTPSAGCSVAINTVNVSSYVINKEVSFRPFGIPNAMQFSFNVRLDDAMQMLQVRMEPTARRLSACVCET
jgi:hypothetical protein